MSGVPIWMWLIVGLSVAIVVVAIYMHDKPEAQEKVTKAAKATKKKKKKEDTVFDESELPKLRETAEEFLEFSTISKGMVSFTKDPNYFTMAFGVNGVNISMYSPQERVTLKNGFMSILNSLKEDTQFLVQSRYVDLAQNFNYYKPIIEDNQKERERMLERIKTEKSQIVRKKLIDKAEKLKQRNNYANHIVDFFKFYTQQSDCIYIKIFVVVSYRHTGKKRFDNKGKIAEQAYEALYNKVKILREQFEAIKLKTYELDSIQAANIIYSSMLKNESSYMKLEDAVKNGLLDLMVENSLSGNKKEKDITYKDEYDYDYFDDEAALTKEEY